MHTYLEAAGFGEIRSRHEMDELITDVVYHYDKRTVFRGTDGQLMAEFRREYAPDLGLVVCGEFQDDREFRPDYCFPWFGGAIVSTEQEISFEKHAGQESYAGACEDPRLGASLIFYLSNLGEYQKAYERKTDIGVLPVKMSALAKEGRILLPLSEKLRDSSSFRRQAENRSRLLSAARGGDEKAIESLTMEEMNSYDVISKRLEKEDVLTIVESCFIPYGVECDQYSLTGTITSCDLVQNRRSGEWIYQMQLDVCDFSLDVSINAERLEGEPEEGRRFRGLIWLQGEVCFPE